eukprot:g13978.t1
MEGNSNTGNHPPASTEAHQVSSRHYQELRFGQGSYSPSSSSASSSPRVAAYVDQKVFGDPADEQHAQDGSAAAAVAAASTSAEQTALESPAFAESTTTAPHTDQDPDPYPLYRRPSAGTATAKSPPRPPSPLSSSSPRVPAPSFSTSSSSSLIPTAPSVVHVRERVPCQYPGCARNAKYGEMNETPIACQGHKRAGQFITNSRGELLRATQDGAAFRTPPASKMSPPSAPIGATGKNRPRLSSVGKGKGQGSQNQPCLFPGCDAQPLYGLKVAVNPVYCASHKKGPMVKIVEEVRVPQDNEGTSHGDTAAVTRKDDASRSPQNRLVAAATSPRAAAFPAAAAATAAAAAPEGDKHKSRAPPTTASRHEAKKARRGSREQDDYGGRSGGVGEQHTNKKGRSNATQTNKGGDSSVEHKVADLTVTSDVNRGECPTPDVEVISPRASSSNSTRMAETTGMAPSAEILILQQAREAARREAEAGGGRRRARAPSRRALEAAGRMTDTGAQWMTKEKKEEMARAAMELRERRKSYRAAGLKAGVVLEEFVAGTTDTTAAAATGAAGDGSDSGPAWVPRGVDSTPAVAGWRKVSPAALSVPLVQVVAKETARSVVADERPAQ